MSDPPKDRDQDNGDEILRRLLKTPPDPKTGREATKSPSARGSKDSEERQEIVMLNAVRVGFQIFPTVSRAHIDPDGIALGVYRQNLLPPSISEISWSMVRHH
ncbi:hypothetical protein [Mesorhizobium sp. Cs1299R1N3]|uniref:hypothetical protein n=1 Tax=Mesorhizobium sp. Cs1299R1N3 TaxID=3015173 RepID=UPI003FA571BA